MPLVDRRSHLRAPAIRPVRRSSHPPPVTYVVAHETTSPKFAAAFARGCGGTCASVVTGLRPGTFAAFCTPPTWPLLQQAQAESRDWYYGDHAYYWRGKY